MAAHHFQITTRWRVEAGISEVAAILSEPERFPDWWGQVALGIRTLDRGDASGLGSRIAVHSKGWLTYHLNWQARLIEDQLPHRWAMARGEEGLRRELIRRRG